MKIIKKLSPIMESISNVGKNRSKLREELEVNHPIGVLPHADAVATEQHIADRAAGLERRANPDKDPLVKEFIDETASAKSRTLHYDVVDRQGLAKILTEAKKNNQKFKIGRSDKLGYRYFVDIIPVYSSNGALEAEDIVEEKDSLTEDTKRLPNGKFANVGDDGKADSGSFKTKKEADEQRKAMFANGFKENLNEDIKEEIKDYINWCNNNNKDPKDGKSLSDYFSKDKKLDEAKYKLPINESEDYINSMYKAYKALKNRKTGYAAVYGYSKNGKFVPFFSLKDSSSELNKVVDALKTREKGQTDVTVYTLFKDKLDDVEDLLKEKGLLKDNLEEAYDESEDLDIIYRVYLINYPDEEEVEEFDNKEEAIQYAKDNQKDYDSVVVEKITTDYNYIENREVIYEDGKDEELDEDLQLYTTTLKDFKPAKEAEDLWNEIIEKGKLEDLEYELDNVFKSDDEKNSSIDINALNDLLVNHPDFIRTLIGLDEAPLEDRDDDIKPVDNSLVLGDDDVEPVDDTATDKEDDDEVVDYKNVKIDSDDDDDVKPLTNKEIADEDQEEQKAKSKWTKIENNEKEAESEKVEEDLKDKNIDRKNIDQKIDSLREYLDKQFEDNNSQNKESELKIDSESNQSFDEDENNLDDITENIANSFIKSRVNEARKDENNNQKKYDELVKKTLPLLEDDEVVNISDDEINEMIGAPVKKDVDETKQEEVKAEENNKVEECKEINDSKNESVKEEIKNEEVK